MTDVNEHVNVTLSLEEGASRLGKTAWWYATQLRGGKLPGVKVGRTWRLTEQHIADAIEILTVRPVVKPNPFALTPTSRRRVRNHK